MRISDWSSDVCSSDLSDQRLLSHHRRIVDRPARRSDPDPRRPHLPAQPRAWSDCRSPRGDRRPALLRDMSMNAPISMFSAALVVPAMRDAVRKLDPRQLIRNPVMFVTAVVATLLTLLLALGEPGLSFGFEIQLVIWLWLTALFGTSAEALAEGRGRSEARRVGKEGVSTGRSRWSHFP